ncbi:hypothetical protein [Magnetospirillum sp. ME-1]|uniref:hypothetical protein n=1 Tax=Magnetospirillum sp. ME-1 TaxID=1639348 RepID=UPI00143D5867|nr:hypothetical protein [Magnetospirillum sp. ME-1]
MPDLLNLLQAVAPGTLPAGAILYAWWKLDHRITVLEARWEILWQHHINSQKETGP